MNDQTLNILNDGGVGVLLTDTLYGLVGQALNKKTVERIYKIKGRDKKKPLIILISSVEDLKLFGIKINQKTREKLLEFWNQSDPVSIILPCLLRKFAYLHRGTQTLAFRLIKKKSLIEILKVVGPLVAPSANPESSRSAENIRQAKQYFGDQVDFYLKGGRPKSKPSKIIKIGKGEVVVIRR
ncbi:Sua5/YciO/YrdC/YwlC family protein [Candidatus Azambacteria bacterium]|nr:Sua5/YciO/YrdC/YwlC family protein [Candidatus Azambacteria bacterium]